MLKLKFKNIPQEKIVSKYPRLLLPVIIFSIFLAHPVAAAIVPKCENDVCTIADFWKLFNNIISFMIALGIAFVTIVFIYAGYTYLTSGGDSGKVKKAHEMLKKAAVGLLIALIAYTLVFFILKTLGFETGFLDGIGI